MTIKEYLNSKHKNYTQRGLVGCLMIAVGFCLLPMFEWLGATIGMIGVLLFAVYALLKNHLECPKCKEALGRSLSPENGIFFNLNEKIRYCVFCGVDFNQELGGHAQQDAKTDQPQAANSSDEVLQDE